MNEIQNQKYKPISGMGSARKWYVVDGQCSIDPTYRYVGTYEADNYDDAVQQMRDHVASTFPRAGNIFCINADRLSRHTADNYGVPLVKVRFLMEGRVPNDE